MLTLETRADLESLQHNQVQESLTVEYKASPAVENTEPRKTEIAKDVSAMANADGGQIIYGMTESNHLPTGLDDGIDPARYSGLWFEQVIQQNVRPQIDGLTISQIPLGNGNIAVVVNIPASLTMAPHQLARDGRYYRRRNFRNDIMEDYEVREAMRRSTTPEPYVEISLPSEPFELEWGEGNTHSIPIDLRMRIGNRSREPALYTYVSVYFDAELVIAKSGASEMKDGTFANGGSAKVLSFPLATPHHFPLFREKVFRLGDGTRIAIGPKFREGDFGFPTAYQISTPGYSMQRGGIFIKRGNKIWLTWG